MATQRNYRPCACGDYQVPEGFVLVLDDLRAEVHGDEAHSTGGCVRPTAVAAEA